MIRKFGFQPKRRPPPWPVKCLFMRRSALKSARGIVSARASRSSFRHFQRRAHLRGAPSSLRAARIPNSSPPLHDERRATTSERREHSHKRILNKNAGPECARFEPREIGMSPTDRRSRREETEEDKIENYRSPIRAGYRYIFSEMRWYPSGVFATKQM